MNFKEAAEYAQNTGKIVNSEPDPSLRDNLHGALRQTEQYQAAESILNSFTASFNLPIEIKGPHRELSPQEQTIQWANQALKIYERMPMHKGRQKDKVKEFVRDASRRLLENPQELETAASVWKSNANQAEDQPADRPFLYEAIKGRMVREIGRNWDKVKPEQ